ncbi:MAG: ParB/RepB/Spo0J family partition protein [Clostridiales bacterium]|nr:ParB/RepB/Spo0J family partition protein [Candidatus Cacconaster stercorequi]
MRNSYKSAFFSTRVQYISSDQIHPNPQQPRRAFDEKALQELADSIRTYGVLQPLTVRRIANGYELVAGERRLRAARLAGLQRVPCLLAQVDEKDSAFLALIENLQRRDLDYWEEAAAIARLISRYGLSQEAAAEQLGKSQSAVANKLRLLRLPQAVQQLLRQNELTERHARALLRLQSEEEQCHAVEQIVQHGWNVAQTEEYIERQLRETQTTPPQRRTTYIIKDVRLFLNSVDRGVNLMRRAGVEADCGREDTEDTIFLTIRIPKRSKDRNIVTK